MQIEILRGFHSEILAVSQAYHSNANYTSVYKSQFQSLPHFMFYPNYIAGRCNKLLPAQHESKSFHQYLQRRFLRFSFALIYSLMEAVDQNLGKGLRRHQVVIWVSPNSSKWIKYPVCFQLAPFFPFSASDSCFWGSLSPLSVPDRVKGPKLV